VRTKGVAHLGPVEGHPHRRLTYTVERMLVIGDIGEVLEALDGLPQGRIERVIAHSHEVTLET